MFSKATRFPADSGRCEFVSPAWYYNDSIIRDRNFYRQNPVPFLVSDVRIASIERSDLEISPNHYNPESYRKHRVTVLQSDYNQTVDDKHQIVGEHLKKSHKPQKSLFVPAKSKLGTSTKSPSSPSNGDCQNLNKFISIRQTTLVPELEPLRPSLQNIITNYTFLERLEEPLVKKSIVRTAKETCPGPGSYNTAPLIFDSVTTSNLQQKLCIPQKNNELKSGVEYLDLSAANEVITNTPEPEKYMVVKSALNKFGKWSNRLDIRSNAVSKRLQNDQKPSLDSCNIKYKLVYKTNPKWSMKGSKRSISLANVNTSDNISPATYNVKNGDIGYKTVLQMEKDRRHMVNCCHNMQKR